MEIDQFIGYLTTEKRYSEHTVKAYMKDLTQCQQYLSQHHEVNEVLEANSALIRSWLVALVNEGVSARSVNRKMSSLKSFFKYHIRQGHLEENPMSKVVAPKTSKRLPSYVEEKEMRFLLEDIVFEQDYAGVRDQVIINLFYHTGMRRSELIGLKVKNTDLRKGSVKVLGKGNKERIIPILPEMAELIQRYLDMRLALPVIADSDVLLLTEKGKQLYPELVYRIVNKYLSLVTTADKRSPHVLRHTFATHMLNNGADLNTIKELLGHANLSATQVYTHNSVEQLKNIYKQAHPRA